MQLQQQLSFSFYKPSFNVAKPFLKWAGGKTQLLEQIDRFLPPEIKNGKTSKYVEPFIGGGSVFFHIAQNYPITEFFISDQNEALVLAYRTIRQAAEKVIECLITIQQDYYKLSFDEQKNYFYHVRSQFNQNQQQIKDTPINSQSILKTAQLIFMNRTCFNGLFRVNGTGKFNVPFGSYDNPTICDADNLLAVANILQKTEIVFGDFEDCYRFVDDKTFVYFDPPYRPISKTASFNSYSQSPFNDASQVRLAKFYQELNKLGAKLMLSNSDPHNQDPHDDFFHTLYHGFHVNKVLAKRAINSNGAKRGGITELLITNY